MTNGGEQQPGSTGGERGGASEPIVLTDPDGAVTRLDPWASWTREQVRAPGGEPALVTRLDQGQLWFAAGRKRSPWRHEIKVGPATVSTPRGRFHATAEPDGGATIACLAGRTRVVTGLREPVLLGPDQTAAVSADGATVVVMDRSKEAAPTPVEPGEPGDRLIALPEEWTSPDVGRWRVAPAAAGKGVEAALEAEIAAAVNEGAGRRATDGPTVGVPSGTGAEGGDDLPSGGDEVDGGSGPAGIADGGSGGGGGDGDDGDGGPAGGGGPPAGARSGRPVWARVAEVVAIAALIGVLVAAAIVFTRPPESDDVATAPVGSVSTLVTSTTVAPEPVTTPSTTVTTPTTVASTAPPSSSPPALTAPGTAVGELVACKRAEGGVRATVTIRHRSGGPDRFMVRVGLVDGSGVVFAQGQGTTGEIGPGGSAAADVLVATAGRVSGACEILGIVSA